MALRLRWLGHPRVEQDGRPVRFETRKAIALLAYLSLEQREHAREALASLLWPEDDQAHALGSLRRALASLHKSIAPARVASRRDALALPDEAWLDVDAFRQLLAGASGHHHDPMDACPLCRASLEQAVALYQGDFLEGFTLPACPAFDDWQLFQRESLRRELAQALAQLARRQAAEGAWEPAISSARRWVGLDPLHEPAHRLLIALYSQAGERGGALRQFERCREALAAELGQAPEPATLALYEQIASAGPPARPGPLPRASLLAPAHLPGGEPLLRTKLALPISQPQLVPRPRLQARIAAGLRGPLTLVTAPAGFGKTTLVASSLDGCGLPVAWLSLDRHDNEPGRFLAYLLAALAEVEPSLAPPRPAPPEVMLAGLANGLAASERDVVLVLDDYQFIHSPAMHETVTFLIEHGPPTFHLLIASRSDPPLPLTRLRARGQLVELRTADLSFTEPESAQFLNGIMGLGLDEAAIAALAGRTEGWIAGLQMAALSLRQRADAPAFIRAFSGTNRYILDYLLEEVLASQPPAIQRFLLVTSLLERLSAPLCDDLLVAAAGEGDHGGAPATGEQPPLAGQSAAILAYLEQANVFLLPLDDQRHWYRYHHLFADLLRAQLQRALGAGGVARLHARAAVWHGEHGSLVEAIHHAALARDDALVERFVQRSYRELVSRGEQSWIRAWSGELSDELVYRRPWLCLYDAYSHSWFGEPERADRLLAEAEKHLLAPLPAAEARAMRGLLAYVKSRVTAMRGDLPQAIALCQQARAAVPARNLALQLDTAITLGYEYFLLGDYARARPVLSETIRLGMQTGAVINTVAASCVLARLAIVEGRLREAVDYYQSAARLIPGDGEEHRGAHALVAIGLADLCHERNELDAALVHLQQGLALLPWWGKQDDLVLAQVTLARIQLAQGDPAAAREAMATASRLVQTRAVFSEARQTVESMQVRLWLAEGDLLAAGRWAAGQQRLPAAGPFLFENELAAMAQARLWLARGRPAAAVELLSPLAESARAAGRMGRVMEMLLLNALALQAIGNTGAAMLALAGCLALAGPEGYLRLFLDEGPPVKELLSAWLAGNGASPLGDYATYLLAHFPARGMAAAALAASPDSLVEPLSPREREVLALLATGQTNREIALALVIAPGTVKAHTGAIYRKLDVANRTEAVARARQLGILS